MAAAAKPRVIVRIDPKLMPGSYAEAVPCGLLCGYAHGEPPRTTLLSGFGTIRHVVVEGLLDAAGNALSQLPKRLSDDRRHLESVVRSGCVEASVHPIYLRS
jgi:hypothetical protein